MTHRSQVSAEIVDEYMGIVINRKRAVLTNRPDEFKSI
jgi:hypothetical protein